MREVSESFPGGFRQFPRNMRLKLLEKESKMFKLRNPGSINLFLSRSPGLDAKRGINSTKD